MPHGLISDADVSGDIFVRESFELFVYDGWWDRVKGNLKTSEVPQNQACVSKNPTRDFASDLPKAATILTTLTLTINDINKAAQLISDWL